MIDKERDRIIIAKNLRRIKQSNAVFAIQCWTTVISMLSIIAFTTWMILYNH